MPGDASQYHQQKVKGLSEELSSGLMSKCLLSHSSLRSRPGGHQVHRDQRFCVITLSQHHFDVQHRLMGQAAPEQAAHV